MLPEVSGGLPPFCCPIRRDQRGRLLFPKARQSRVNLPTQVSRIRRDIERIQPGACRRIHASRRDQSLIGCLGIVPFADHPIRLSLLRHEMQNGLEEIVVEPQLLIEQIERVPLGYRVEPVIADIGPHERIVLLFDEAIIILLIWPRATEGQSRDFLAPEADEMIAPNSLPLSGWR